MVIEDKNILDEDIICLAETENILNKKKSV